MKITGTRNYIDVEFDDKTVRIEGELTTTPSFYASIRSIRNWNIAKGSMPIDNKERHWIVAEILRHRNPQFEIIFED